MQRIVCTFRLAVTQSQGPRYIYEMDHLVCFMGGVFALDDIPEHLELAKEITYVTKEKRRLDSGQESLVHAHTHRPNPQLYLLAVLRALSLWPWTRDRWIPAWQPRFYVSSASLFTSSRYLLVVKERTRFALTARNG